VAVAAEKTRMFGQVVIGPPGSGKSTYCHGMKEFLSGIGRYVRAVLLVLLSAASHRVLPATFSRRVAVVNLDPANDVLPYDCAVNICELVDADSVAETLGLGPNGGTECTREGDGVPT
jgi:hypothetical protein